MLLSNIFTHMLLASVVSSAAIPVADAESVQLAERKDAKEVFHEIGNFFKTGDIHDDGKHNDKRELEERKNAKETGDIHDDGKHHDKRELEERKDAKEVFGEIGNFFKTGDIHDDGKHHKDD
ncbi:hypothetical protein B0I72DRAFT_153833 [Yarrowia lipolytica]|nr:hypothetical protein B0I72DRAFT_153833 [Yarrowia lipolytica]